MKFLLIFLLVVFSYLQYALWFKSGGAGDAAILQSRIVAKEQEINRIESGNRRLIAEVRDLEKGLDAIEERARSLIGMIKDDEIFFRMGPSATSTHPRPLGSD